MRKGQRLVGLLWRWHRRTGVAIFVFLLLMSATGVVLNHTAELDLDSRFIHSRWVLGLYGDDSGDLPAFPLEQRWLTRTVMGQVYLDDVAVAECRGDLVGAAIAGTDLVAACTDEVLLLTPDGELIESVDTSMGLPAPIFALGVTDAGVALMTASGWRLADFERLDFDTPPAAGAAVSQLAPGALPQALYERIPGAGQWLTWERLVLDLHSGRILGPGGVLFMDLVAVLLACVAVSGITMWLFHRGRRKRSR